MNVFFCCFVSVARCVMLHFAIGCVHARASQHSVARWFEQYMECALLIYLAAMTARLNSAAAIITNFSMPNAEAFAILSRCHTRHADYNVPLIDAILCSTQKSMISTLGFRLTFNSVLFSNIQISRSRMTMLCTITTNSEFN